MREMSRSDDNPTSIASSATSGGAQAAADVTVGTDAHIRTSSC
jgi:hypothetical protein